MSKVSFCFSNNSEVSGISLWVRWVSLFSFQFFAGFNNWFLIRRHISLSGLDLSRIQHLPAPINLHRALWLICASRIICPVTFNSTKVKSIKKITYIWRQWGKSVGYFEKKWPLKNVSRSFGCWESHGSYFLYRLLWLCWGMKICGVMRFARAEWARAEISAPLYSFGQSVGLGGFVPQGPRLVFTYVPWGSFFLFFLFWLQSSSCWILISRVICFLWP